MPDPAVVNASPLILLGKIDRLGLLRQSAAIRKVDADLNEVVKASLAAVDAALKALGKREGVNIFAFAGDGDFMMTVQELATALQYGTGVLVLVFNNSMYGTIRMHQEREYPGRVSGSVRL